MAPPSSTCRPAHSQGQEARSATRLHSGAFPIRPGSRQGHPCLDRPQTYRSLSPVDDFGRSSTRRIVSIVRA